MPESLSLLVVVAAVVTGVGAPAASQAPPGSADLAVVAAGPGEGAVGDEVVFGIEVRNAGPDEVPDATLWDSLPPGLVPTSVVASQGDCTVGQEVVCDLGTLAAGEIATIQMVASLTAPGTLTGTALVDSSVPDPDDANNQSVLAIEAAGQPCTLVGTAGDDLLTGGPGDDVICGLDGNDVLAGGNANDVLLGGAGDDSLAGGWGDDLLDGGDGSDLATFEAATVPVVANLSAGTAVGEGSDGLAFVENLTGSPADDVLRGDGGSNLLSGLGGTDVLFGMDGDDALLGDADGDYLDGGDGADELRGGPGLDACSPDPSGGARFSCLLTSPTDGNDAGGLLDVRVVRTSLETKRPAWTIESRRRWGTRRIWDRGYVIVYLDTRRGPEPDFYAIVRSKGSGMEGVLFRVRSGKTNKRIGAVTATRAGKRAVTVQIALRKVTFAPARRFYRWSVQSMYTGNRCRTVCFDLVPSGPGSLPQPRP